jgi:hypothetical protein
MHEKGKKRATFPASSPVASQLIQSRDAAFSDPLVSDQKILREGRQTDGLASIFCDPSKLSILNELGRKRRRIGRGEWIRTTDLLVPNQAL